MYRYTYLYAIGCIVFIYSMYVGALCAVCSVWCFMIVCIAYSFETHYQDHLCNSLVEEPKFKSRFIHDFFTTYSHSQMVWIT